MHIQLIGASVNAAVMAYHLAEIGHYVKWDLYDSEVQQRLFKAHVLFNDYELSAALHRLVQSQQIMIHDQHATGSTINACIFAFSEMQYQHFIEDQNVSIANSCQIIINYSHLGLDKTEQLKRMFPDLPIVYIPDFLQEGQLIKSFVTQSLIVGCDLADSASQALVREIFRPIFPLASQYNLMSIRAAEFTKLSISGFLATKISFMNDLSNAAEALGVDIEEVRIAMATDQRIGTQYLHPGCGFGGANLTRDVLTLKQVVQNTGNSNSLLDKIWDINEYQKEIVFRKLWMLFDGQLQDKVIAFWGAAFKPDTNSIAQAPIRAILEACWAQGAITRVHDPRALNSLAHAYPDQPLLQLCHDQYGVVEDADALCLITEWKQYYSPDFQRLKQSMRGHDLIDGRNIYNPKFVTKQGFNYYGIGRKSIFQ